MKEKFGNQFQIFKEFNVTDENDESESKEILQKRIINDYIG